jgi:protein-S-isoprenylcysteine O-methyltransferase Ste14
MLNLITNIAWLALLLTEIFLNRLLRSKSTDKQNEDKNSISIIWVTIIIVIPLAVLISKTVNLPIYSNSSVQYVGVIIIFIGIILRLFAVVMLGQFFTVDVTIRQNHKLKKDGLYKYLRHPSYFASLISFIGMGWTFNNWLSLLLLVVAILIVFINRIKIEEKLLIQYFGSEYTEYKKHTNGLIPFIY